MTKMKLLGIAVVGLLIINLGIIGFLTLQKPPHPQNGPHLFEPKNPKNGIIEMLHFNKEQVVQYENLIEQHEASIRLLDKNIRETKRNLYETLTTENDEVRDSLIKELGTLQESIETVHYNHFYDIKNLCNPNQLEYFTILKRNLVDIFNAEKQGVKPLLR